MDFIAYLIERELLARRAISLPFIGVLSRERMSARFSFDRSHITAPRDVLTLTADADQSGDDFIKLIAAEAGTSSSEAIETYNQWYASSIDEAGAVLTIDSVCSIDLVGYSIIAIDGSFEGYLSPLGDEAISIGLPINGRGQQSEFMTKMVMQEIEVEEFVGVPCAPRSSVLEGLPIIEDVIYESIEIYQTAESIDLPQHNIEQPFGGVNHIARPTPPNRPARPAQRHRPSSGVSSVAVTLSIIVAVCAALYIAYYFASKHPMV